MDEDLFVIVAKSQILLTVAGIWTRRQPNYRLIKLCDLFDIDCEDDKRSHPKSVGAFEHPDKVGFLRRREDLNLRGTLDPYLISSEAHSTGLCDVSLCKDSLQALNCFNLTSIPCYFGAKLLRKMLFTQ